MPTVYHCQRKEWLPMKAVEKFLAIFHWRSIIHRRTVFFHRQMFHRREIRTDQNSTFCSVRGSHNWHISNRPFCFHYMTLSKVTRAQEEVLTSQVAQRPQICPELATKTPSQKHLKNNTFRFARGSDSYHIGYQPLYLNQMPLSKVIRAQKGVPTP